MRQSVPPRHTQHLFYGRCEHAEIVRPLAVYQALSDSLQVGNPPLSAAVCPVDTCGYLGELKRNGRFFLRFEFR
jgi:hypothetical protein